MDFETFRKSRVMHQVPGNMDKCIVQAVEGLNPRGVFVYEGGYWIAITKPGVAHMDIETSWYESNDLEALERILFNYAHGVWA